MAGRIILTLNKIINLTGLLTGLLLMLLPQDADGQLVGSPGSNQSAVQRCVPASYLVSYQFVVDSPTGMPTGYVRITFRMDDMEGNNIELFNYYKDATHNDITLLDPTNPFNIYGKWVIMRSHTFSLPPDDDCQYNVTMILRYDPDGPGPEPYYIIDLTQSQPLANWHTDDDGDGIITIDPVIHEVCEGEPLIDFRFQDASTFACTEATEPELSDPNDIERHVQFVYGTSPSATQGIPNLSINVYGTVVQLTDATGNPMPNSWTVNPLDGSVVAPYATASGFFEGPVISTGPNPIGGSQQTFPISYPANVTVANDYFEVTVRNWNYCNPWNGNQVNPNATDARTATARIIVVDAPPPPVAPDVTICEGEDNTLTVTSAPVGEFHWYSDAALTNEVAVGVSSYTPPETAPGVYDYYVLDQGVTGLLCIGPATEIILTINGKIGRAHV